MLPTECISLSPGLQTFLWRLGDCEVAMKWARAWSFQEFSDVGVVTPLLPAPGSVIHQWESVRSCRRALLLSLSPEQLPLQGRKWSRPSLWICRQATSTSCRQGGTISGLKNKGHGQCASSGKGTPILVLCSVLLLDCPPLAPFPRMCHP